MGLFAQIKKGEKRMLQNTSAGLSEAEAKARLAKVGENRLRGKKGASVAAMFFSQFKDLMILILAAATLISVLMGEGTEAITIIIIVLMNATMGFLQEYRTEKTLEALKELSAPTARVRRGGRGTLALALRGGFQPDAAEHHRDGQAQDGVSGEHD